MYNYNLLIKGALDIKQTNNEINTYRLSKKQCDFYSESPIFILRAFATAGIRLEFFTYEKKISFEYKATKFYWEHIFFDIYENDVYSDTITEKDNSLSGKVTYNIKHKGKTKITIYLPYTCDIILKNLSFGEIEYLPKENIDYLALGDSITQGMGSKKASFTYPSILADKLNLNFLNQGVGSFYFCADSLDNLNLSPKLITVLYGANDYYLISTNKKSFEQVINEIHLYFEKLAELYPDSKIYVITPIWCGNEEKSKEFNIGYEKLRKCIKKEAELKNFNVIEGLDLIPHNEKFYCDASLVHPNAEGYNLLADNLLKKINI